MSFDISDWLYPDAVVGRQPQNGFFLDDSNPLTAGIYCLYDGVANALVNDYNIASALGSGVRVIGSRGQAHARPSFATSIPQKLVPGYPGNTSDFTLISLCSVDQASATARTVISVAQSAAAIGAAVETGDGSTIGKIRGRIYIGGTRYIGGSFTIADNDLHLLAFRQRYNVEQALFVDDVKDPVTGSYTGGTAGTSYCGAYTVAANQRISLNLWYNRALTDGELSNIADNIWLLGRRRSIGVFMPAVAGGGTLNAAASGGAQAAGSADLAAQVSLAAIGVATAGGSAALSASIPLAAAGLVVAGGSAGPTATITISAAGLAAAAGSAGLSAAVLLAGAGAAQAAGNATLAAQLAALASGAAQAGGSATLTGGAPGSISASGAATASGAAVLSVTVSLQAAGAAQSAGSATGSADSPGAIAASGGATASGAATWTVTATLTAAGFVQAMGAGQLSIGANLTAQGSASSAGWANLSNQGATIALQPGGSYRPRPYFSTRPANISSGRRPNF